MKKYLAYMIVGIATVMLFACKKDEPVEVIPEIKILTPEAYNEFAVLDTLMVSIRIDNESTIDLITIQLLDKDFIPVHPSVIKRDVPPRTVPPIPYILADSTLESDVYKLRVVASIKNKTCDEYVSIFINNPDPFKELKSIWIVSDKSSSSVSIDVLNPGFETIHTLTYQGNYAGSDLSSPNQQFFIGGSNSGDLIAYHAQTYDTAWIVPIIANPVQPYFTAVRYFDETLFVGFWDGYIKGFNNTGTAVLTTSSNGSNIPCLIQPAGKYLVSASKQRSNVNSWWMTVNYIEGGASVTQQYLGHSPVILGLTYEEDILFYSNDANGLFSIFLTDPENGIISTPWVPYVLPDEKLICGKDIGKEQVILSTENGIYVCKHQSYLAKINQLSDVNILEYEERSETIFAVSGNTITLMDFQGNIISELPQENTILNLHFLYNR